MEGRRLLQTNHSSESNASPSPQYPNFANTKSPMIPSAKTIKHYPSLLFLVLILSIPVKGLAQDSTQTTSHIDPKRLTAVTGLHIGLYTGTLLVLNQTWYKDYPRESLHSFDDSKEWQQVDKIGHGWSAYNLARASAASWQWAGKDKRSSALLGAGSAFAFMTVIELLDGTSSNWGWSWSDMAANTIGSGLFLAQELAWKEQRIQYKFSFHTYNYKESSLEQRADALYGKKWYERMLKDYNAQTYWFSANLRSFFPDSKLPPWLNLAVGYGADGMYGGFENLAKNPAGQVIFDRRDIARVRQYYISPDIDFTKIKTNKKWLKTAFFMLNAFKMPAPSLLINKKGIKGYFIYF